QSSNGVSKRDVVDSRGRRDIRERRRQSATAQTERLAGAAHCAIVDGQGPEVRTRYACARSVSDGKPIDGIRCPQDDCVGSRHWGSGRGGGAAGRGQRNAVRLRRQAGDAGETCGGPLTDQKLVVQQSEATGVSAAAGKEEDRVAGFVGRHGAEATRTDQAVEGG